MPAAAQPGSELVLRPGAPEWRRALSRTPDVAAREFRRELELPTDQPIVMSGHQPTFWHPGILAKWIAMVQAATTYGARAVWLVVDHDAAAPSRVRLPLRRAEGTHAGSLVSREFDLGGGGKSSMATPACAMPAFAPRAPVLLVGESFALASVREGLGAMVAACVPHASATSAAEQVALATRDLIHGPSDSRTSGGAPGNVLGTAAAPSLLLATNLGKTSAFRELVARMAAEPARCATAYNEAVADHPGARLRPLKVRGDEAELPLWMIESGLRRSVGSAELAAMHGTGAMKPSDPPWAKLAPKALLLTLLLRLYGCELFIHGLGGGGESDGEGYDAVMQGWATRWLGEVRLAPLATVSATVRLPFGDARLVTQERAARATWMAWHARSDPDMMGDGAAATRKRSLVAQIEALPRNGRERRERYSEIRSLIEGVRVAQGGELLRLANEAKELEQQATGDAVRADRTWPFEAYRRSALQALVADVALAMANDVEAMPR